MVWAVNETKWREKLTAVTQVTAVRNEESCTQESRIVLIPVVVEPIVVPVPCVAIPVEITNVQVAIGVAVCMKCRLYHHPLNIL